MPPLQDIELKAIPEHLSRNSMCEHELWRSIAYSHVPLNVPEANTPNLTVPAIDRPSIMPFNFNFIGIGRSTLLNQSIAI